MNHRRVAAVWVCAFALFAALQLAHGITGTTAYFTDSHAGSMTFSMAASGPSITVSHTADGSNGWNKTSPVALVITVTPGTAPVTAAPTCTDNAISVPISGTASLYGASVGGEGSHAISCTVTDTATLSATGTDTVTIDTVNPVVTVPANIVVNATNPGGATVSYVPTFSDATSGLATSGCVPASGSTFPIGTMTVTCTATDKAGNTSSHSFTITVGAHVPVAAPTQAPAASGNGWNNTDVVVTWNWSDAVSDIDAGKCTMTTTSSGEGTLTLTATCKDLVGTTGSASYTVKVDKTLPLVSILIHPIDPSASSSATFTFSATDTGGSTIDTVTCKLDALAAAPCTTTGSQTYTGLANGLHTVDVTATDKAGNSGQASLTWVVAAAGPSITVSHVANGSNGWNKTSPVALVIAVTPGLAPVTTKPVCTDNGSPLPVTGTASPYGASVSGEGTHAISCTVTDTATLSATGTDTVTIDTVKPAVAIVTHPANPTALTSAPFTFTAIDSPGSGIATVTCKLDTAAAVACTSPLTYSLAAGTHTLTVTATDLAGNVNQATYTWCITATGPSITVSHRVNGSNGWNKTSPVALVITVTPGTAAVTAKPACTDNGKLVTVSGTASPYGASVASQGSHAISCKVTDTAKLSATGTDTVRIDPVAPTVTVPANITVDATSPGGATVSYCASFSDATSGVATSGCTPPSGSTFPIGTTTVTCTAIDKAGNTTSKTFTVTVRTLNQTKAAILSSLQAQLAATKVTDTKTKLSSAITHVGNSLALGRWVTSGPHADGSHLDPVIGGTVFDEDKAAVTSLIVIKYPAAALKAAIASLDTVDQLLAQSAINDAIAAHTEPAKITLGQKEMTAAQSYLSKGHFDTAIDHWKAAWRLVTP